jgi:hypothetical protein
VDSNLLDIAGHVMFYFLHFELRTFDSFFRMNLTFKLSIPKLVSKKVNHSSQKTTLVFKLKPVNDEAYASPKIYLVDLPEMSMDIVTPVAAVATQ